jgi:deoxyribonuclease IV
MDIIPGPCSLHSRPNSGLTMYFDPMFGSHLSIAGNLSNALREAESLGMDTVQVFTKNQQQWKVPPLSANTIAEWKSEVARLGWQGRTVAHASYLINLASPDDRLWEKSIRLMRVELERCEAMEIPLLVHHPGSSTTSTPESGMKRLVLAYRRLLKETRGFGTISCLENTVGSGANLGGPFEQLADLRARICEATGEEGRIGFCFDSCHAHAFGYDMSSRAGGAETLAALDRTCGLSNVRALHINDSKGARGSRLDRHEHIGEGSLSPKSLSDSGFAAFVSHPRFHATPKILETPKGNNKDGTSFDTVNLRRLRKLLVSKQPIKTRRERSNAARTKPRVSLGKRPQPAELT